MVAVKKIRPWRREESIRLMDMACRRSGKFLNLTRCVRYSHVQRFFFNVSGNKPPPLPRKCPAPTAVSLRLVAQCMSLVKMVSQYTPYQPPLRSTRRKHEAKTPIANLSRIMRKQAIYSIAAFRSRSRQPRLWILGKISCQHALHNDHAAAAAVQRSLRAKASQEPEGSRRRLE